MTSLRTCGSLLNPAAIKDFGWRAVWTKLTFLAFCWASLFIFLGLGLLFYFLVTVRLKALNPWLDTLTLTALIGCGWLWRAGFF